MVPARASSGASRLEAVAAVDGARTGWLERQLGHLAAVGAGCLEHLARPTLGRISGAAIAVAAAGAVVARRPGRRAPRHRRRIALGLADRTARGTPLGRLGEPALGVELLLAGSEGELLAAIQAAHDPIGIHGTTNLPTM